MDATSGTQQVAGTGYGARPVSIDLARNQPLTQVQDPIDTDSVLRVVHRSKSVSRVAEQLAVAHWPADHRIYVCSAAGGTGRTTLAGLIALTLASLKHAHLHRPIALGESNPQPLSQARHRWGAPADSDQITVTRAGGRVRVLTDVRDPGEGRPLVVVDALAGIVTTAELAATDPSSSVVLLTRPDRASIAETADVLVWLQDSHAIPRDRIAVVINDGAGRSGYQSRPAATALAIRCRSIHRLPAHKSLGPGTVLPCGQRVPGSIRKSLIQFCADIHRSIRPAVDASAPSREESDATSTA